MPAVYAAVLFVAAWYSHFPIIINDVFALRWQAEHLSLSNPGSFYNGFFPIGFPLLLHAGLITGNPILALMLLQFALAPFYAAMVYRLLIRLVPGRAVAFVLPLALFAPPVIHAIASPTPDFFAAFAVLAGFLFLTGEDRWNFIRAGVCIGIALHISFARTRTCCLYFRWIVMLPEGSATSSVLSLLFWSDSICCCSGVGTSVVRTWFF